MSRENPIFVRASAEHQEVAEVLADVLEMSLTSDDHGVYVSGPATLRDQAEVGGKVSKNFFTDPDDTLDEDVINYFDVVWTVRSRGLTEEEAEAEAEKIFHRLVDRVDWPILLMSGFDYIVAARNSKGLVRYTDGPGGGPASYHLWRDWVPDSRVFVDPDLTS